MKTRIISGTVLVALLIAILVAQMYIPVILVGVVAILCSIAVYEALYTTALCKNKLVVALGMLLALVIPFAFKGYISLPISAFYTVFVGLIFLISIKYNKEISVSALVSGVLFPIILSYAFSSVPVVAQKGDKGLLYIILLFCWSAVADTGAYFVGVLMGKHKMAPDISPKKTWEGLFGGIVFGVLATFLACNIFANITNVSVNITLLLVLSPVFVILGVLGDLSASLIKRQCGIKDFGNLIPGHGGILDRFDSILMIAQFFAIFLNIL